MFSNESCKHADACRFCWMCRHICPVGGATGNEAWTPRARGLLVSMMERGTEFDPSIAEAMYQCSLCDACANDCVTGFKPSTFILEARTMAVADGIAPEGVMNAIERIQSAQNIYGDAADSRVAAEAEALPPKAEVLLYLGQTGRARGAESGLAVISLLKKAGVDFTILKDEPASGAFLAELMGYTGEVQQQAAKAADAIRASGAKKVVALNPHDACIFKEHYTQWGLLPGVETVTATAFLAELVAGGRLTVKKTALAASFQDPCRLSRGMDETEPARVLLSALGVELKELFLHGKMGRCCGGAVLNSYSPEVVSNMVRVRKEDALRIGSKCIITACPDCQDLMARAGSEDVEILDLYRLLDQNS